MITAEEKRQCALAFVDYLSLTGACTPLMIEQLKLAARLWAYEQGAVENLTELQAENAAILQKHGLHL